MIVLDAVVKSLGMIVVGYARNAVQWRWRDNLKLIIPGEYPTLNEVIKASKSHYMAYANQKKDFTTLTMLNAAKLPKINFKADYIFTWYRKNKMVDPDNIQVGTKYILDGLVKAGKLKNDGWDEINSITHYFEVDKQNPRVEIEVVEI